jgi:hypothetical protein
MVSKSGELDSTLHFRMGVSGGYLVFHWTPEEFSFGSIAHSDLSIIYIP